MLEKIIEWIKTNRLKLFFMVALSAVLVLLYVDNTVKINTLLNDIAKTEKKIQEIKTENEILKSKIISLQSAERITTICKEKFGLHKPSKVPIIIEETGDEK